MKIKIIKGLFAVCKVQDITEIDFNDEFLFMGKTDEEISVVCRNEKIPSNSVEVEKGWAAFRIEGILDFSLVGILSKISCILAENKIGIFAISTFNTDYILIKENNIEKAKKALTNQGYEVV